MTESMDIREGEERDALEVEGEAPQPEGGLPPQEGEAGGDPEWLDELTPRQIVAELDRYIIGQEAAKKAVAIALRNRWRRQRVDDELREEIAPNNLILIGPTGVGKTEIARRLARLAGAPFVKVEASKFTEVGYVGRDAESMVRDLVDTAVNMVRAEREDEVQDVAEARVEDRLLDLLLPPVAEGPGDGGQSRTAGFGPGGTSSSDARAPRMDGEDEGERGGPAGPRIFVVGPGQGEARPVAVGGTEEEESGDLKGRRQRTREKLRGLLRDGKLEDRTVEIEVQQSPNLEGMMVPMGGMEGMDFNFTEMLQDMLPKKKKRRTVSVAEARRILLQEELDRLVDMDEVVNEAMERTEDMGIVFLDEIDKIAGERATQGPDVSREGVQRDLLPVVEGSNVQTRYGFVRTDHILFIAAGAFHVSKPSDLIPELQGRFPIRVELHSLGEKDFVRILQEPRNALVTQYKALLATEGASLDFSIDGIEEIARIAAQLNDRMENIGARRLQTVLTTLLEDVLFELPDGTSREVSVDREFVRTRLAAIVEDEDLRRYIL
jgi:ATP-dependent HslUV protease ATP-binding subunit HslU